MADSNETPLFTEQQNFPAWLRLLMAATMVSTMVLCIAALFHESSQSGPAAVWLIIGAGILVPLAVTALIWFYRMDTEVRSDGIYVRCFPFHLRFHRFAAAEIAESYARRYRPIIEYGGWGIRYSMSGRGRAYNVSGNQGLQLIFKDGKKLLIGSHQPEQLESAVRSITT